MRKKKMVNDIEELYIENALCQRVCSYKIREEENIEVCAWQCNMADIKNIEIKLPTALWIVADREGYVKSIDLLDNFKGSQGIPCLRSYLNRKLKYTLKGVSLFDDKEFVRGKIHFDCQHIDELMCGTAKLLRYGKEKELNIQEVYNKTRAIEIEKGIRIVDELAYCGESVTCQSDFLFDKGKIQMSQEGKLKNMEHLKICTSIFRFDKEVAAFEEQMGHVKTNELVVMYLMKAFARVWRRVGDVFGFKGELYFSNLVPTAFYGLFIQSLSLILYPDNYNYFQHAVSGLQRTDNKPLCIGMINSTEEAEQYFDLFRMEDMYS